MSPRHGMFCTPSHGCEECRAASRGSLLFPFRWARDELRGWRVFEWLVALYCALTVVVAWFGGK